MKKIVNVLMLTVLLAGQLSPVLKASSEISEYKEEVSEQASEQQSDASEVTLEEESENKLTEEEAQVASDLVSEINSATTSEEVLEVKPEVKKVRTNPSDGTSKGGSGITLADLNLDETNAMLDQKTVYDDFNFDNCETGNNIEPSYVGTCTGSAGWRTTDNTNQMQIVNNNYGNEVGVELNSYSVAGIFKDYEVTPGQRFYYAYRHLGRQGIFGNDLQSSNIFFGPAYELDPYSPNMGGKLFPYDGIGDTDYLNVYRLKDSASGLYVNQVADISGVATVDETISNGRLLISSVTPYGQCSDQYKVCNVVSKVKMLTDAIFDNLVTLEQYDNSDTVKVSGVFNHVSGDYASGVKLTFEDKNGNLDLKNYKNLVFKVDGTAVTPASIKVSSDGKSIEFIIDTTDLSSATVVQNQVEVSFEVQAADYERATVSSKVDYYSSYIEKEEANDIKWYYGIDNADIDLDAPPTLTSDTRLTFPEIAEPISDARVMEVCNLKVSDDLDEDIASKVIITYPEGYDSTTPTEGYKEIIFTVTDSKKHTATTSCEVKITDLLPQISASSEYAMLPTQTKPYSTEELLNVFDVVATEISEGDLTSKVVIDQSEVMSNKAGVYRVYFTVTDDEGNVARVSSPALIVDDGTMEVANGYAMSADDFNVAYNEFDDSEPFLVRRADVIVYDIINIDEVTSEVTFSVDKGTWAQIDGSSHEITINVVDDEGKTLVGKTVVGNIDERPVIQFTTQILEIAEGEATAESFKTGVKVTDEGVDISSEVKVDTDLTKLEVGVHAVEYSVTDANNNTTTKTRVVVINDGTYSAGKNTVLQSKDYTIRSGQVDTSEAGLIRDGSIKLYSGLTAEELPVTGRLTFTKNGYSPTPKTYYLEAYVTNDSENTTYFDATVLGGEPPKMTVPKLTEIQLGEEFDPLSGITVSDTEDTEIAVSDVLYNKADYNLGKAGVYPIRYTLTDSDFNVVSGVRVLIVNDGSIAYDETYILQAENYGLKVSEVNTTSKAIITTSNAKLYHADSGKEIAKAPLSATPGSYKKAVGVYKDVQVKVEGSDLVKNITVTVDGGTPPKLTVPAYTEIDKGTPFNVLTGVTVSDVEDTEMNTSDIKLTPSVINVSNPGVKVVNYQITDSDLNVVTAKQVVVVKDDTIKVGENYILQAQNYTLRLGQVDTSDSGIIGHSQAKVYSKATGSWLPNEQIVVDKGSYTNAVDKYTDVTLKVKNEEATSLTREVTVITGESPVITAPKFTELELKDEFSVMAGVSATDSEDGTITAIDKSVDSVDTTKPGIYPIDYTVTDSDGNKTVVTQVVVVNDGSFEIGDNFILVANGYELRLGQVDTSANGIIGHAGAKVYSKSTGREVIEEITVDKGSYTNAINTYADVVLTVANEKTVTKTITVKVIGGEKPTITAPSFKEVAKDGTFDVMSGVSATDSEDGKITEITKSVDSIDTSKPGVHTIEYTVTDSDGNQASASQVVVVNDGSFVIGDNFILEANNYELRRGEVDTSASGIIGHAGAKVYAKATGLVVDETITVAKGSYTNVIGTYTDVVLTVANEEAVTKAITVKVVGGEKPTITAPSFKEVAKDGSFDVMTGVSATDDEDGDFAKEDITVSLPSINTSKPGVYTIEYSVTDSDGNKATARQVVVVNDGRYVIGDNFILEASNYELRVGQVDTSDKGIIGHAGAKVLSKSTGLAVDETITVDKGSYTNAIGTYTDVVLTVANEEAVTKTITVKVLGGEKPTITAPSFTEVAKDGTFDVMAGVSATDSEDQDFAKEDISTSVSAIDTSKPGVYPIEYSVIDSDGNKAVATQVVVVNDGSFVIGDNFILEADGYIVRVGQVDTSDSGIIGHAGAKVYAKSTGLVVNETITVDKGSYTNVVGTYGDVVLTVANEEAVKKTITVVVDDGQAPTITAPSFKEVAKDGSFDVMTGVSATDSEDGDFKASDITATPDSIDTSKPGVYTVGYSVTDSDGNTTTAKQVVVVNDGSFVVGENFILEANSYELRLGQVDTSDNGIIGHAGAKVYAKATGLVVDETITVDKGSYTNAINTYTDVVLTVANEEAVKKTITVKVIGGENPTLTVPSFTEVAKGGNFDVMTGVSATDSEDGDFKASDITVNPTSIDTSNPGVYKVEYSVTDSDGNKTVATQVVVVNDGNFVVGDNFILEANSYELRLGQVDTSDSGIIGHAGAKVYSKATGKVVDETISVDKGSYTNAINTYKDVVLKVANEEAVTKTITVTVIGGENPTLTVPSFTEVAKDGNFDVMTGVSATDNEDGAITEITKSVDSIDTSKIGVYPIEYSVTDSDGNKTVATQVVVVNDESIIIGDNFILEANSYELRLGQVDTSDSGIIGHAEAKVYSKVTGLVVDEKITVDKGTYTNAINTYEDVVLTVANEKAVTKTITVTVVGGEKPTITAPSFTEVSKDGSFDVMSGVSATDTEDGDFKASDITATPASIDTSKPGVYTVEYSVTDSDSNSVTAKQVVVVNDGGFVIGDNFIIEARGYTLRLGQVDTSDSGIINHAGAKVYAKSTGSIVDEAITVDKGTYTDAIGTYEDVKLSVSNETAVSKTITVVVDGGDKPVITAPSFKEVDKDGNFDVMSGVSATDTEDGDFKASDITVNPTSIDTSKPGVYKVEYSVTDSDSNKVVATQVVVVNDGNFVVGDNFILEANGYELRLGQVDTSDSGIINHAGAKVYAKATGSIVDEKITVDKGSYTNAIDTYTDVVLTVANEEAVTKTITVKVVGGDKPVITAPSFKEVDKDGNFDVMSGVSATDTEDGDFKASDITATPASIDTATPGVYTIEYSVTDSDSNKAVAKQVVVVNDGSFVVGDNFILEANSYELRLGQVDTSASAIIGSSNAKVYAKSTGQVVDEKITVDKGSYTNAINTYTDVVLTVANEQTVTKTITVKVVGGDKPVITAPSFKEVAKDGSFDVMTGVSATDPEDGDFKASDITATPASIDTATPGVYTVEYSVTDSDSNNVTAKQIVVVNDGGFVIGDNFIIEARGYTLRLGQVDTSDSGIINHAGAKVYSKANGSIVDEAITVDKGSYTSAIGTYEDVKLSVSNETAVSKTITVVVDGGDKPVITAPSFKEVDKDGNFDVMSGVSATDIEDGDFKASDITATPASIDTSKPGVYTIEYSVTDSDSNKAVATQVVVVNDGNFVVGDNFILEAKGYELRLGQVDTSASGIINHAGAKVYSKATGSVVDEKITVDKGTYTNAINTYKDVVLTVANEEAVKQTITVKVVGGDKPVITAPNFKEVDKDGSFDVMSGVSATDTEDGDFKASDITATPASIDTAIPGVYTIEYSVTDSDSNKAVAKQVVVVNDGSFVVGDNFILEASGYTLRLGQVDTSASGIIRDSGAKVYAKATGQLVSEAITVDKGTYTDAIGTYEDVKLSVSSETAVSKTITVVVDGGDKPVITAPSFKEVAKDGSFDVMSGVSATDAEDGDFTASDIKANPSTIDTSIPGVYTVEYYVKDSDDNSVTATQVVVVNDERFVVGENFIIEANGYSLRLGEVNTSSEAIITTSQAKVYSKLTGQIVDEDITVDSGSYTDAIGTYSDVKLSVTNESDTSIAITVVVAEGKKPTITAPEFTEVAKDATFDVMNGISANDPEDGSLTASITPSMDSIDTSKGAVYPIEYSVTDSDGNTTVATQVVVVKDDTISIGENFIINANSYTLRLGQVDTTDSGITRDSEVKVYSKSTGQQVQESVTIDKGSYTEAIGTYDDVTLSVTSETATQITISVEVTSGDKPTITAPTFKEVAKNGNFDIMAGVSATDKEDGDFATGEIKADPTAIDTSQAGVFVVEYTVIDSDGNSAAAKQVVVVNDGSFVVGEDFIIAASDYTLRLGQVDTSDNGIITHSAAKVYDKLTGQVVDKAITVDKGTYTNAIGTYKDVVLKVKGDDVASQTITVEVIGGDKPVITNPKFKEVAKGTTFNVMTGVSATDNEDGNFAAKDIKASPSTIDTTKPGVYVVEYTVVDSDFNQTVTSQTVVVNDGTYKVGVNFILAAKGYTLRLGDVDTTDQGIIRDANAKVYSKATGQLVQEAITVNSGSYTDKVGTYKDVVLSVTNEPETSKAITVIVKTGEEPTISAPTFTEVAKGGTFDIMADVSATDKEDGDFNSSDITATPGSIDTSKPGVYTVEYSVTDSDSNETTGTHIVVVNDGSFKVGENLILEANDYILRLGEVDTSSEGIINHSEAKVYSKETGQVISEDITVDSGSYTNAIGAYSDVVLTVESDQDASLTIKVTVEEGNKPTITTPGFSEVAKDEAFDVMTGVSATDVEDGDFEPSAIKPSPATIDTSKPGVYPIEYTVTDSDGNTTVATHVVVVTDDSITIGENFVIVANGYTLRLGQVDTSSDAIINSSEAKVYSKVTGKVVAEEIAVDKGTYTNAIGTFADVVLSVANESATAVTITVEVIAGDKPVIEAPKFKEVAKDASFDVMSGVKATDGEDGDLTGKVVASPTSIDTSKPGVYPIEYTVTDSDFNTHTVTQVVVINDGSLQVGDNFIIEARGYTVRVGEVDTSDSAIIGKSGAKVYSKATGKEVQEAITVDSGSYTNVVDVYSDVVLTVANDPEASKTITVEVTEGKKPTLTVPSDTEVAKGESFNVMTGVTADDGEDGDLTSKVVASPTTIDTSTPGVFPVEYSVIDSDGNAISATQVVIVNDGSFKVGENFIIEANGYELRLGQVDTSSDAIITKSDAKVYSKTTGKEVDEAIIVDKGSYTNKVDTYEDVVLTVTNDQSAKIAITVVVLAGDTPELTVPAFTEVDKDGSFEIMDGVTAIDGEDGDITEQVTSAPETIDTSKPGVYPIEYTITDSDSNTITKTQVVVVNDGSITVGDKFIIAANGYELRLGQVDTSDNAILSKSQAKVYSKTTGKEVDEVITVDSGSYTNKVDTYEDVVLTVTGDQTAQITITIVVISGEEVKLTAPEFTEIDKGESFNVMSGVTAIDPEDGDLTSKVVANPTTIDTSKPGVHPVTYTITDSDGNETVATQVVVVNDGSLQVGDNFIIEARGYTVRVGQVDTSDSAIISKSGAKVYSKATGQEVQEAITVDSGSYTNVVDIYSDVVLTVANDPEASKTITVEVTDGEKPTLTVPSLTEVAKDGSFNVMSGVTANDGEDGDLTSKVVASPTTIDTSTPGVFPVEYSVIDSDGNAISATQVVIVNDGSFKVGENFIIEANGYELRLGQVDTSDSAIIGKSSAKVYSKTTGKEVDEAIVVDKGSYTNKVDTYKDVVLTVAGDPSAKIAITIVVVAGDTPELIVPEFTEVDKDGSFAVLDGVSATDGEDGDITEQVTSAPETIDTSKPGVYPIEYTITDSDSNTITKTQVVVVNDGSITVGDKFIIAANGYELRLGQVDTSDNAILSKSQAKVYSKTTGKEVDEAITVDSGSYTNKVDTYEDVVLTVTGDQTAEITITIVVISGEDVKLTAPEFTEIDKGDSFNVMSGVTAIDPEDGDLTSKVVANPTTIDTSKPGVHPVTYTITDSDGNETVATQVVVVNDGSFQVGDNFIIAANGYKVSLGQVDISDSAIIGKSAAKVYSKATGLVVEENITVDSGSYVEAIGIYSDVVLSVTNEPSTARTITVEVVTGELPELIAPEFTEVPEGGEFEILDGVTASDNEDGDLSNAVVVSTGEVDTSIPGVYPIEYSVVDSDGNETVVTQVVLVNDGTFVYSDQFIIEANDFELRVSEVNTSDVSILADAQVKVYNLKTGLVVSQEVNVNKGQYDAVVGEYPISFAVASDQDASIEIIATVIGGDKPQITIENDYDEISLEQVKDYDLTAGVTASDSEDGDISDKIVVTSTFDQNSPAGIYVVDYQVTDTDGNTMNVSKVVLVNDGTLVSDGNYVISATDIDLGYSKWTNDDAALRELSQVKVYDISNRAEVTQIEDLTNVKVETSNWMQEEGIEGQVKYSYTTARRILRNQTISITVKATLDHLPVMTLDNDVIMLPTGISTQSVYDSYLNKVSITDKEDGNLNEQVKITAPKLSEIKPGQVYSVIYSVTDSHGNTVTKQTALYINDGGINCVGDYLVVANDFTMESSQYDSSDANIILQSNLTIYDLAGNKLNIEDVKGLRIDSSKLENKNGSYIVTFIIGDDAVSFDITVTITGADEEKVTDKETGVITVTGSSITIGIMIASLVLLFLILLKRKVRA